jgi:hypothetical protein
MDLLEEQKDERKNIGDVWNSCCLKVDKQAVKYFIQVGILASLILTSLTMLIVNDDCNSQRNWSSLLMVSVGLLLPNPKMNN